MLTQLIAVARHAFMEAVRQGVYAVLLLVISVCIVLCIPMSSYTFADDNKFFVDMSISCVFFGGMLLAAFCAAGVVSREIENKTIVTVVSKPMPRPIFVVGKYIGIFIALTLAVWIWVCVLFVCLRHGVPQTARHRTDWPVVLFTGGAFLFSLMMAGFGNYFFHRHFAQTLTKWLAITVTIATTLVLCIGRKWEFQAPTTDLIENGQLMMVLLLLTHAIWLLGAIAIAASTRSGQILTLILCVVAAFLGLVNESAFGWADNATGWGAWLARLASQVIPNLAYVYQADAYTQQNDISWAYIATTSAYTWLFTVAALFFAISLFQTRQTN